MPILTPKQAAEHLGICERTLRRVQRSGGIPYVNVGMGSARETPRYDTADLDAWLASRKKVACPPSATGGPSRMAGNAYRSMVADFQAARDRLAKRKRT
ncbi:MAG: helix-turn-helix domain-containing protein [Rhizobiaceae bacterium]